MNLPIAAAPAHAARAAAVCNRSRRGLFDFMPRGVLRMAGGAGSRDDRTMIRVLVVTAGASLALTSAAQAAAFTQLPGAAGCLMQIDHEVDHGCGRVGGLDGAQRLTLSPDDRFVYVASGGTMFGGSNGVVTFRRDPSSGALTKAGCVTATSGDGRAGTERACTRGDALIGAPTWISARTAGWRSSPPRARRHWPGSRAIRRRGR